MFQYTMDLKVIKGKSETFKQSKKFDPYPLYVLEFTLYIKQQT